MYVCVYVCIFVQQCFACMYVSVRVAALELEIQKAVS